ncbi:DUF1642 domain-containing protein [Listeria monocytogenes]|nr:DUF1642 domain-containing protein [Listeria monocytogenes]EGY4449625.1 DUF1642 domain-containing protein [Listeria monocytogenes]EHC6475489.1 DUF1642 domain-containing protein [Listeria monocytogenes]EHC6533980.1 DUF1642 domain-containing protein [Listeria monocytogenes]EIZ6335716.1 DUF1642 domain-containing protein [Listeria monocytogenes]
MNFKVGDRAELILRSKKRVGTVEEVYNDTQKCKVQIDEFPVTVTKPQKYLVKAEELELVVVPQFVADWIKHCKQREYDLACLLDYEDSDMSAEMYEWLISSDDNQELLARAWFDGYEVEEEPLYYVRLPLPFGYLRRSKLYPASQNVEDASKYSEKEIKDMDERYWQFAVLVEEAEGEDNE